jgi:tetratricopeptide (TPR) repeat protein
MAQGKSSFSGVYSTFFQTFGLCLVLNSTIFATETTPQQAFMLKRIAEYWKEGDSILAKSQILSFLQKYPENDSLNTLYAMLGDIYIQERNFESAYFYYEKITSEEISSKAIFNKIVCLYELQKTDEVICQITKIIANPIQNQDTETLKFLLAESLVTKAKTTDNDKDKEILLREALPLYDSLLESKYSEHVLIPAAEIAVAMNKYQEACKYYTAYLKHNPHHNETILFKIASLQENFKPSEAIRTYTKLYKLRGTFSAESAYKQIKLLFKEKNYKDLVLCQEEAMEHISTKDLPMAHYFIGKSLLNLEDFAQAKNHLVVTLSSASLSSDDQKIVLSNLITCAGKTKDITLLNSLIEKWEILDKKDPHLAEAYLLKFQLLNISDKKSACAALEKIKIEHPYFMKENLFYII